MRASTQNDKSFGEMAEPQACFYKLVSFFAVDIVAVIVAAADDVIPFFLLFFLSVPILHEH